MDECYYGDPLSGHFTMCSNEDCGELLEYCGICAREFCPVCEAVGGDPPHVHITWEDLAYEYSDDWGN